MVFVSDIRSIHKVVSGLQWDKIISVLDPRKEFPSFGENHLVVRMEDTEHPTSEEYQTMTAGVMRVLSFTRETTPKSGIIIHCHAGVSRSPALAWLIMIQQGVPFREAFSKLIRQRPQMDPNQVILDIGADLLDLGPDFKKFQQQVSTELYDKRSRFLGYGG